MWHIRYKDISNEYIVVDTEGWFLPLNEHPFLVLYPHLYEMVNQPIPEIHNKVRYVSPQEQQQIEDNGIKE
jgi:hypothetical protein